MQTGAQSIKLKRRGCACLIDRLSVLDCLSLTRLKRLIDCLISLECLCNEFEHLTFCHRNSFYGTLEKTPVYRDTSSLYQKSLR
jgi:hypothetical protein